LAANQIHRDSQEKLFKHFNPDKKYKPKRPSNEILSKQFDKDFDLLKSRKMSEPEFNKKYYEGVIDLPSKINYGQTFGAPLKTAAKFAGPLGVAYGVYDYLSGTSTSTEADLYPEWTYSDD